ncbi:MAG TPA: VTT domain-containing protein [Candidatus Acidoferrales bacterium]
MNHQPAWIKWLIASFGGPGGLFIITFLDSSILSFPLFTDLFIVYASASEPSRMVFYAGLATLGSLAGCLWLYYLARKGGELFLRKRASGPQIEKIRGWYERNEFLTIGIPAVLPPPAPFKVFVIAAGVFRLRVSSFAVTLLVARGARYFLEGYLAVRFGRSALDYLRQNKALVGLALLAFMLAAYLISRLWQRRRSGGL